MRIAISQRYLPHYRVGFFDELEHLLAERGDSLRLFYSFELGEIHTKPAWARRIKGWGVELPLEEISEKAVIAPGLMAHLARFDPELVVLEDLSGLANSLCASLYCRLFSKPYLIWGLGRVPGKKRSRLRVVLGPLIKFLYSGASGFICYSSRAIEVYARYGKPKFLALNAYLSKLHPEQVQRVRDSIYSRHREPTIRLVSIGSFKAQKRFNVLLEAMSSLSDLNVELHLVGDGPLRDQLECQSIRIGLRDRVFFHGAMYAEKAKENLFHRCHLGVMPGRGGLAIQELMAHGIPVVSGVADGTESDLISHRTNGYVLEKMLTPEDIELHVRSFISLSESAKLAMAEQALQTALSGPNTENMAAAFVEAIKTVVRRSEVRVNL